MRLDWFRASARRRYVIVNFPLFLAAALTIGALPSPAAAAVVCARTLTANVVALDQPLMWNRLGSQNINGAIFALKRDVVEKICTVNPTTLVRTCLPGRPLNAAGVVAQPGQVMLRPDKRPRPVVLRVAAGDCLTVNLTNLLAPVANPNAPVLVAENQTFNLLIDDQVADRLVSFHAQGMQLVSGIADDASFVGQNASSLAAVGQTKTYQYWAEKEGAFLATSHGATFGSDGSAGNNANGLFGQVDVMPKGARIYRGDVTEEEFRLASSTDALTGLPIMNYEATYPNVQPWIAEGKANLPVLNMIQGNEIVHSEIDAVVAGPNADGTFPASTYPLESVGKRNPTVPNRLEAFRDFASVFHDEAATSQAFPGFFLDPILRHTLAAVGDVFMINYGSGAIGPEIVANRLGVGPMHDCLDCSYEEFFLTSFTVGDPAALVDVPANVGLEQCGPGGGAACGAVGPKATKFLYPGDLSNVHHSYIGDFTKFRNTHTGKEHHIFHLHNHQWLFNASDDNSNYLDAQAIGPGSGYTYEINFGGSGNRNKSAGDAIFHCHLYPHFAQGMWYLWRHHDVLETGTRLAVSGTGFHTVPWALQDGTPAAGARALPDGEVVAGAPISALIPLPGKALPVRPGRVTVAPKLAGVRTVGSVAVVDRTDRDPALVNAAFNPTGLKNPGFPFWVGGIEHIVGQRTTTPPLDMKNDPAILGANGWDGGLPRHALQGFADGGETLVNEVSRTSFDKEIKRAKPVWFPEDGTDVERAAMWFHAGIRFHPTIKQDVAGTIITRLDGVSDGFRTNGSGAPGTPGAPYHESCIDDNGNRLVANVVGNFFDGVGGKGVRGSSPFNATSPRIYQGANFQYDAVINKTGYHYPQQRIIGLWQDVMPTIQKTRPGEPLVMRNNTFDCTMYNHTNLVPKKFELDDYQVSTPTDIIGQHIHLPKWDLTTTDGAANGWNYEDGTLAAQAVQERIDAINVHLTANPADKAQVPNNSSGTGAGQLLAKLRHPFFGQFNRPDWLAARTTLQRWFFDPVVNVDGVDRGLGIIFTHDHYGPSTHQQIGLYATVLVEPAGSKWVHNETGVALYTRADGGPTSWQAAILTGQVPGYAYPFAGADIDGDGRNDSYREFYVEYSDFQHAYLPGVYVGANQDGSTPGGVPVSANTFRAAIKPSVKELVAPAERFPLLTRFAPVCPVLNRPGQPVVAPPPRPCPEAISADDPGTFVANYRQEPVGLRIFDPAKLGPDGKPGAQADGARGDLAFALQSRTDRAIAAMNVQPVYPATITSPAGTPGLFQPTQFPAPINSAGVGPGDPFTPMMRAYFGDRVRVKVQAGGDEETHTASIFGMKWLQSGSGFGFSPNSGWRNTQQAGISEQFTFAAPVSPSLRNGLQADYLYSVDTQQDAWWAGMWGILRTYNLPRADLFRLPNTTVPFVVANRLLFVDGVCPLAARVRPYDVTAVLANEVLPNQLGVHIPVAPDQVAVGQVGAPLDPAGGTLVYNPRPTLLTAIPGADPGLEIAGDGKSGPLHDPTAMMWVRTADLEPNPARPGKLRLKAGAPVEPLVVRAAAGECVRVTMRNRLPTVAPDLAGYRQTQLSIPRDILDPQGVTSFEYNLVRPSSTVGMHPQLVDHDIELGSGVVVGNNAAGSAVVAPGGVKTVNWYAGDIGLVPTAIPGVFLGQPTPVEFGATSISPADVMKQGSKGLIGTLIVEPAGSSWVEADTAIDRQTNVAGTRRTTRASATVNGTIRSLASVWHKGTNMYYADGAPVGGVFGEGPVSEDTYEGGTYGINYGSEPLWFRFGVPPETPLTGPGSLAKIPNAHEAYSNTRTGGDPVTPVWTAPAGAPVRIHHTMPSANGRASTVTIHGHVWQRQPYVCPGSAKDGLTGRCRPSGFYPTLTGAGGAFEVGSRALGDNPLSFSLGGQDQILPMAHFDFVLPSAGGANAIRGDYLFHDRAGVGNLNGPWAILRVQ